MDSLIFELQIVLYFQLFLSANVGMYAIHIPGTTGSVSVLTAARLAELDKRRSAEREALKLRVFK